MNLLSWINPSDLYIHLLNINENAIDYLLENPSYIDFSCLCENKNALDYILTHLEFTLPNPKSITLLYSILTIPNSKVVDFICKIGYDREMWYVMCSNPCFIDLIIKNPKNYPLSWYGLSKNKLAVPLLKKNMDKIIWHYLCMNESKEAIELLEQNLDKIDWLILSTNPFAIRLLEQNPDKISNWGLCYNPVAIHLIEDRIDYFIKQYKCTSVSSSCMGLSSNRNALHILQKYPELIDMPLLSTNTGIFELNYQQESIRRINILREELLQKTLHPSRIQYWLENGLTIDDL
jgi:hypothetical protein